jgi:DNA-directed RNA polymerase subunit M/transcription elongation factor TFIIS
MEEIITKMLLIEENETIRKLCKNKKINQSQLFSLIDPEDEIYSECFCKKIKEDNYDECIELLNNSYWNSPIWNKLKEVESKRKEITIKKIGNTTIVCKKCKKQNVNCTLVQKRSADEGMTQCFQCYECDFCWQKS